jgi:hypothetical protein
MITPYGSGTSDSTSAKHEACWEEDLDSVQLATVRGLCRRDRRHEITLLIHNAFEPLNVHKQQAMTILRDQKPNRVRAMRATGAMPSLRTI